MALVVPPMVRHRVLATAELLTFFVEPRCVFASQLRKRYGNGISAAPEMRDLREDDIGPAGTCPSSELDPRLLNALNTLRDRSVPVFSPMPAVSIARRGPVLSEPLAQASLPHPRLSGPWSADVPRRIADLPGRKP